LKLPKAQKQNHDPFYDDDLSNLKIIYLNGKLLALIQADIPLSDDFVEFF
jgi:hypothetical protein